MVLLRHNLSLNPPITDIPHREASHSRWSQDMVRVRPPKPSPGRGYTFAGGWPLMTRCGHRGDGAWPDLRGVTMKSLREALCRRDRCDWEPGSRTKVEDQETDSRSHLGPGMEASQERKSESEDRPGEPTVQRGLEEGQRARGEVSWGKWCRMVQGLIWEWQQPPGLMWPWHILPARDMSL